MTIGTGFRRAGYRSLAVALAAFLPNSGQAQETEGWCFVGDGCTGPVPLSGTTFYTCEENCVMENPTAVRGLEATLYDVTCSGDSGGSTYRMMLSKVVQDGEPRLIALTPDGIETLERCAL